MSRKRESVAPCARRHTPGEAPPEELRALSCIKRGDSFTQGARTRPVFPGPFPTTSLLRKATRETPSSRRTGSSPPPWRNPPTSAERESWRCQEKRSPLSLRKRGTKGVSQVTVPSPHHQRAHNALRVGKCGSLTALGGHDRGRRPGGGALPGTHAGRRGTFERPGAIMAGDARGRNFLRSKSSTSRGPCPEPEASFLRAEKTMQSACSAWHKGFLEQDAFCRAPPAVRENAANAAKRQGKGSAPCARRNVCGTGQAPRPYEGPQPPSPPAEGEQQPRVLVRCHALDQAERHSPPENESLQKTSWENLYRLKGYLRYCPRGCLRRAPLRTRTRASRKSARDVLPGGRGSVIRRSFPMRRKVP